MEIVKPGHCFYKLLEYSIQIDSAYLLNILLNYADGVYEIMPTCINVKSEALASGGSLHAETNHENCHGSCHTLLLFKAVQFDAANCIKYLIANGTNPNCFPTKIRYVQPSEVFHFTALQYAIDLEMFNSAEMLLQNSILPADPNISANIAGVVRTPLSMALNRCNEKLADLLLRHGATSMRSKDNYDDLLSVVTSNGAQPRKNIMEVAKQNIFAKIICAENRKFLDKFHKGQNIDNNPPTHDTYKSNHHNPLSYFSAMATLRGELIMPRMLDKKFAAFIWANSEIVQTATTFFNEQKNKNSFISWLPTDIILVFIGQIILRVILDLQSIIKAP